MREADDADRPEPIGQEPVRPALIRWPEALRSARLVPSHAAVIGVLVTAVVVALVITFRVWQAAEAGEPVPIEPATPATAAPTTAGPTGGDQPGAAPGAPVQTQRPPEPAPVPSAPAGVNPTDPARVIVHVTGAVRQPGVVEVPAGARVTDAIEAAGGIAAGADTARINLARVVTDGEMIWVPTPGEEPPEQVPGSPQQPSPSGPGPPQTTPGDGGSQGQSAAALLVNVNTADQAQLEELPGVGPVTATAIIGWREENGPFTSAEELLEVDGIGPRTLEKLRPHVTW